MRVLISLYKISDILHDSTLTQPQLGVAFQSFQFIKSQSTKNQYVLLDNNDLGRLFKIQMELI